MSPSEKKHHQSKIDVIASEILDLIHEKADAFPKGRTGDIHLNLVLDIIDKLYEKAYTYCFFTNSFDGMEDFANSQRDILVKILTTIRKNQKGEE